MKYKALLLDRRLHGVAEDDVIIAAILQGFIAASSPVSSDVKRIGRDWRFQELCAAAHGDTFKPQRVLEMESLSSLIADRYQAGNLDALALSQSLFDYWAAPEVLEDGRMVHAKQPLQPVCIVSNIDTSDLANAITHAGWRFEHRVTSESCRAYKPRPEMFLRALKKLQCAPQRGAAHRRFAQQRRTGCSATWD